MSAVFGNARLLVARGARLVQTRFYSDEMKLTFAAANKVFYENAVVRQVDVPSFSGDFGILAKHVPTLAVLKPGVVNVYESDGSTKKIFISSGTVTVNVDSSVQVLAEEAHLLEDLDPKNCRDALATAQQELNAATTDQAKIEASMAVDVAEILVKATN